MSELKERVVPPPLGYEQAREWVSREIPELLLEPCHVRRAAWILLNHLKDYPKDLDLPLHNHYEKRRNTMLLFERGLYDTLVELYDGFGSLSLKCCEWERVVELFRQARTLPPTF